MTWSVSDFCPEILPDETVYSLLERWLEAIPVSSINEKVRLLLGSSNKQLDATLPSFLTAVAELSGENLSNLMQSHSIIPYFRNFCDKATYQTLLDDISHGDTHTSYSRMSLIAGRVVSAPELRFCPVCIEEDIKQYGISYWHVMHQLPGVTACLKHGVVLHSYQRQRRVLVKPPQSSVGYKAQPATEVALKLAEMSLEFLKAPVCVEDSGTMAQLYTRRLNELGLASGEHYVHQSELRVALESYWKEVLHEPCIAQIFALGKQNAFPSTLFYAREAHFHPLKHLLLIAFLFENTKAFNEYSNSEPDPYIKGTNIPKPFKPTEVEMALNALRQGCSLRAASRQSGLSVGKVKQLAISNHINIDRRESQLFALHREKIIGALEAGRKTADIAQMMDCSIGAVEKILGEHPEIKDAREKNMFNRKRTFARARLVMTMKVLGKEALTRNDIKREASASYTWLYKHDKEWLYETLPERQPSRYWGRRSDNE